MKKNKKGQMGIGGFVLIFIGVIVALALFSGTFDTIGKMTNIYTATNVSITTAAINGTTTLEGRENTSAITVVNATDYTDWTANFTVESTDAAGNLAILLKTTDAAGVAGQNATTARVSYTYKPDGYNDSIGARSIIALVFIFSALAIAMFAFPQIRDLLNI